MFGSIEQKLERLVRKHKWESINKTLAGADTKTKLAIAKACGASSDEQAVHLLAALIKDEDEAVQLQAVKSIGKTGRDSAKTHLQWAIDHLPESSEELKQAIKEAIAEISQKLKEEA